jgi:microcystin-dependent protein
MAHITSTRRGISYADPSTKTDAPDVTSDIALIVAALDLDVVWLTPGVASARPATPVAGSVYWATDTTTLSLYTGATVGWITLYPQAPTNPGIPIGMTIEWDYLPTDASVSANYLEAFGQALSRSTYVALNLLASNAGYPHGDGNGTTTFNVADKRGRVTAGKDNMGGSAANRITSAVSGFAGTTLGIAGGAEGVSITTAQMPVHNHTVSGTPGMIDPAHIHTFRAQAGSGSDGTVSSTEADLNSFADTNDAVLSNTTGITLSVGSLTTANQGSGSAHLNTQPTIIANKLLRVL